MNTIAPRAAARASAHNRILAAAREYLAPETFTVDRDDYRRLADEIAAFNPGSDADTEFGERLFDLRGYGTTFLFEAEREHAVKVLNRLAEWNPTPRDRYGIFCWVIDQVKTDDRSRDTDEYASAIDAALPSTIDVIRLAIEEWESLDDGDVDAWMVDLARRIDAGEVTA